jgi:hypothetical protein
MLRVVRLKPIFIVSLFVGKTNGSKYLRSLQSHLWDGLKAKLAALAEMF